jgi:hypothetical protein
MTDAEQAVVRDRAIATLESTVNHYDAILDELDGLVDAALESDAPDDEILAELNTLNERLSKMRDIYKAEIESLYVRSKKAGWHDITEALEHRRGDLC